MQSGHFQTASGIGSVHKHLGVLGIPFILQLLYILKEQILERFLQVTVASESCYGAVIRRFLILQQPAEYQILPAQLLYFTAGIYALHIGAHQYFK